MTWNRGTFLLFVFVLLVRGKRWEVRSSWHFADGDSGTLLVATEVEVDDGAVSSVIV